MTTTYESPNLTVLPLGFNAVQDIVDLSSTPKAIFRAPYSTGRSIITITLADTNIQVTCLDLCISKTCATLIRHTSEYGTLSGFLPISIPLLSPNSDTLLTLDYNCTTDFSLTIASNQPLPNVILRAYVMPTGKYYKNQYAVDTICENTPGSGIGLTTSLLAIPQRVLSFQFNFDAIVFDGTPVADLHARSNWVTISLDFTTASNGDFILGNLPCTTTYGFIISSNCAQCVLYVNKNTTEVRCSSTLTKSSRVLASTVIDVSL